MFQLAVEPHCLSIETVWKATHEIRIRQEILESVLLPALKARDARQDEGNTAVAQNEYRLLARDDPKKDGDTFH